MTKFWNFEFSEIFEFSSENSKFLNFERILTELWSEKFEWFGPSPIEPFHLGEGGFDTKSTMTPAVLDAIEAIATTRRLQGRRLQVSEPG